MAQETIGLWTGSHNVYHATAGALRLTVAWEKGGYTVRVNDTVLPGEPLKTRRAGMRRAIAYAQRLLAQTQTKLAALAAEAATWEGEDE